MNIGNLTVSIVAETQKFVAGITKTQGVVKSFTKNLGFLQTAVGGLGAAFTVHSFAKTADDIDKLAKASDRLNVSTENLMGLGHAADLSGVAVDQLTKALTYMQKNVGDDVASSALGRLGLSATQLRTMRADDMFLRIARAINGLGDASEQTNIAMELFGRSGAELLPLINEGDDAILAMMKDASKLGMTFSRDMAKGVEEANDAVTRLTSAFGGLKKEIVVAGAPAVAGGADFITNGIYGWRLTFVTTQKAIVDAAIQGNRALMSASSLIGKDTAKMQTELDALIQKSQDLEDVRARMMGITPGSDIRRNTQQFREQQERDRLARQSAALGAELNIGFGIANRQRLNPQNEMFKFGIQKQLQGILQQGAFGIGRLIGGATGLPGQAAAGAARMLGGLSGTGGMTPGFALTQSGSADSYRQQARISRQNDAMKEQVKLAKDDNKEQKKHTNLLENIAGKLGGFVAANL